MSDIIDLSGQPRWPDYDRSVMPQVEEGILGIRTAVVAWIGRIRAGVEMYAPVPDVDQGGTLELAQAQARHLHAKLGELIEKWDTEPRDLVAEADTILSGARFVARARASSGYEIETDGTAVFVYYSARGERTGHLRPFADTLTEAGYTGPDGAPKPVIEDGTDDHAPRIVAIPPAAEKF